MPKLGNLAYTTTVVLYIYNFKPCKSKFYAILIANGTIR
jgi:hypothetical protein